MSPRFADRIALVTGASRGIGRAVARGLAEEGAHVVLLARTVGGLEELDDEIKSEGGTATLVPLDLADMAGIDRLGQALYERFGRLDMLFAAAGLLGPLSPTGHVPPKDWEAVMAINVTANWRLIRSLDPLLRHAEAGRALFVTSGAAHVARAYWGPYAVSKAALEVLVRTYAAEMRNTSAVRANLFNPGAVRTRMRAQAMPGEDPMTLPSPEELVPAILPLFDPAETRTGLIYDYPSRSWLQPRLPGPAN